jgi:hypothetical protein
LKWITEVRNALAEAMFDRLSAAELGGKHVSQGEEHTLVRQAEALVDYVNSLAEQSMDR